MAPATISRLPARGRQTIEAAGQVVHLDRDVPAKEPALLAQQLEDLRAGNAEDVHRLELDERADLAKLGAADREVELQRSRVWMDRHDAHRPPLLVDLEAVEEELRLLPSDELD